MNKPILQQPIADTTAEAQTPPLLFEMIRSFVALAKALNLSHAVKELNSTRQTVRRHILALEEIKGGPLFKVTDRRYEMTDLGHAILPEAEHLLAQAVGWVAGTSSQRNGLQYLRNVSDDGWVYYQQQQPIGKVFSSSGGLMSDCLRAWSEAGGDIEHEAMQAIRPRCMTFRKTEGNWVFTEVGEESSFMSWFGWTMARSAIGRPLGQLPGGHNFDRLVSLAYTEVEKSQSMRFDHCYTTLYNGDLDKPLPICFERLLLGSRFADGSFVMVSAVRRTYDVEIEGVTHDMLRLMPEKYLM